VIISSNQDNPESTYQFGNNADKIVSEVHFAEAPLMDKKMPKVNEMR
jgi:hypothetical protein